MLDKSYITEENLLDLSEKVGAVILPVTYMLRAFESLTTDNVRKMAKEVILDNNKEKKQEEIEKLTKESRRVLAVMRVRLGFLLTEMDAYGI